MFRTIPFHFKNNASEKSREVLDRFWDFAMEQAPFQLRPVQPAAEFLHTSHALSPEAVLATYRRVTGNEPPEARLLCVRGESFELGEGLSAAAAANLESAWFALRQWVASKSP